MKNKNTYHTICKSCLGSGKKSQKLRKKVRNSYNEALTQFKENNQIGSEPIRPKGHLSNCEPCGGTGLIQANSYSEADTQNYPHIAIIGAGIGGAALAVACLHRGIPYSIYERDVSFNARAQGYGLTLQQASKAIEALGISSLNEGVISTRHVVHDTHGKILGEWGIRKWLPGHTQTQQYPKRTNIHIARQALRKALLEQLPAHNNVQWGHQLVDFETINNQGVRLSFEVDGEIKHTKANILVGADGIRSVARKQLISEEISPLRYLGCMVILGICPLEAINDLENDLLDSATVFQTANGHERIYFMPYSASEIMWQLSFPMLEAEAKALTALGPQAIKNEACKRTLWHTPIPEILAATSEAQITGYPVYDRDMLTASLLQNSPNATLIGDAAHPMSPFKGQGANQALLDALSLARQIYSSCGPYKPLKINTLRESILSTFELEMITRSSSKVADSAAAAEFLHTQVALHEADEPRGRNLKPKDV